VYFNPYPQFLAYSTFISYALLFSRKLQVHDNAIVTTIHRRNQNSLNFYHFPIFFSGPHCYRFKTLKPLSFRCHNSRVFAYFLAVDITRRCSKVIRKVHCANVYSYFSVKKVPQKLYPQFRVKARCLSFLTHIFLYFLSSICGDIYKFNLISSSKWPLSVAISLSLLWEFRFPCELRLAYLKRCGKKK